MPQSFQIAIDGPVAVGKSTIARILAQRLGFLYVDTGAMYRATALLAQRLAVPVEDEEAVAALLRNSNITLATPQGEQEDGRKITVFLDDEDVSWVIRSEDVSQGASRVAQHAKVREQLVKQQQAIASNHNVVMEGRDITFRVLPHAQMKIFLTASPEKRAEWRHTELFARSQDISLQEVKDELIERDKRDMEREVDPLHVTPDAWLFDRSQFDLEGAIDHIEQKARALWRKSDT